MFPVLVAGKGCPMEKEGKILKIGRTITLAAALYLPAGLHISKNREDPSSIAHITAYYCQRIVGYRGYDSGGFCGSPAYGGETISGRTAACGSNWKPHDILLIEGFASPIECNDAGNLAANQIDIFFQTDKELHDAQELGLLPKYSTVTKVEN